MADMMPVANSKPKKMATNALRSRTFRREAIREPVHPPVPGSGTHTISTKPQNSAF